MNKIPKDPYILISYLNTKMRDENINFNTLCIELNIDEKDIFEIILKTNYKYDRNVNRFIPNTLEN